METWYYEVVSIDGDYANLKHLLIIPIHFVLCFTVSGADVIVLCIGVLSCRITVFVLLFITAGALCHRFAHHHGIISRRVL